MLRVRGGRGRLTIVLLLGGFAVLAFLALAWRAEQVIREFELEATTLVERLQAELESAVHSGTEDLVFLAESPEARRVASDNSPGAPLELEALFLAYAKAQSRVFQVRLLAADGRELLRIERRADGSLMRAARLQDKAKRYYFSRTSKLSRGDVFVSELDLNVEEGKIERPLRPTLRFATPLRDDSGKLRGVIVVNRSARDLIGLIERNRHQIPGILMLVDRHGNYLSHPNPEKEWGGSALLDTGEGLGRDHPSVGAWLGGTSAPSTLRRGTRIFTRAKASRPDHGPRVLLVSSLGQAVSHRAREFVPLGLGLIATLLVLVFSGLSLRRQQELSEQVTRESALREQIAAREENLRRAQDRLVASARLAALTESAAALAHELRNPLGAIINSVSLLKSDQAMSASDQALLGVVLAESERLERAVSDFLDLSRRPPRRIESFDLNETACQILKLAAQDLGQDMQLEARLSAESLPLHADPDEVRQILWNLLRNARTANRRSAGRAIIVRTARETREGKAGVQLEVVDEGPGLKTDHRATADPAHVLGMGLGLIVVAGIAAHYSGHFEICERSDARGATARVWLPCAATETPWQPS